MSRPAIAFTVFGILLAFTGGWAIGMSSVQTTLPDEGSQVSGDASSEAQDTAHLLRPPLRRDQVDALVDAGGRTVKSASTEPQLPATDVERVTPPPVKQRLELSPTMAKHHMDIALSALRSEAQGIAESCYVDLRKQEVKKLSRKLDGVELVQAHAAIAELVDAEYQFRLGKNTVLVDQFVWGHSPPKRWTPNKGGVSFGEAGILVAGQFEFGYFLNYDANPRLAQAWARKRAARKALARFLAK